MRFLSGVMISKVKDYLHFPVMKQSAEHCPYVLELRMCLSKESLHPYRNQSATKQLPDCVSTVRGVSYNQADNFTVRLC